MTADHEPAAGYNLPPGLMEVPDSMAPVPGLCCACESWRDVDGRSGLCARQVEAALEQWSGGDVSEQLAACAVNAFGRCPDYVEYGK